MSTKIYDAYTMKSKSLEETAEWIQKLRKDFSRHLIDKLCLPTIASIVYDIIQGSVYLYAAGKDGAARKSLAYWYTRFHPSEKCVMPRDFDKVLQSALGRRPLVAATIDYGDFCATHDDLTELVNIPDDAKLILYPDSNGQTRMLAFGTEFGSFLEQYGKTYGLSDYHYQNQTDKPDGISQAKWSKRVDTWKRLIGPDYIPSNHGITIEILMKDQISNIMLLQDPDPWNAVYNLLSSKDFMQENFKKTCECMAQDALFKKQFSREYIKEHPEFKKNHTAVFRFARQFRDDKENPKSDAAKKIKTYERKLRPEMLNFADDIFREWLIDLNMERISLAKLLRTPFKELHKELPELFYEKG